MKHLHPFPARMAPELVFNALPDAAEAEVLDPMMGSGTTLVSARAKGHRATGLDRDPLAVLLANVATRDLDGDLFQREAARLLCHARVLDSQLSDAGSYPPFADDETREFVRYWFDKRARRQLASFMNALLEGRYRTQAFLKCAISRMIITKQGGVTLAEDISHSRPHRTRDHAPTSPFELFPKSVSAIVRNARFLGRSNLPRARVLTGDARRLPFANESFDYIITSPPYLNAIDYLRGHKLSLVWFGYNIGELRGLRATNVGSNRGIGDDALDGIVDGMVTNRDLLPTKLLNMLRLYVKDLNESIAEMARVLRPGGCTVFVIGDCAIRGFSVSNSSAVASLAVAHGLQRVADDIRRPLPTDKRYLPPPDRARAGSSAFSNRMRDEVILRFQSGGSAVR